MIQEELLKALEEESKNDFKNILIFGEVNPTLNKEVISDLLDKDWIEGETLSIFISSEGGTLSDCFSIIDMVMFIKNYYKLNIVTYGLGEICSAGFYLFLMGDERIMLPNCRVFVHEHIIIGNDSETYSQRVKMDKTDQKVVYNIYLKWTEDRLNLSKVKTKTLLKKNGWLTQKDIQKYNIVTGVMNAQRFGSTKQKNGTT